MRRSFPLCRWSQLWTMLLCVFLALQPVLALSAPVTQIKAPTASKQAPIAYADPDGLFQYGW